MIKVLISGALGKMGRKVYAGALNGTEVIPVCGVDVKEDFSDANFPVYSSFSSVKEKVDAVIDFSAAANLPRLIEFLTNNKIPSVLCATGYGEAENSAIKKLSESAAVFRSANMSLGVNVLIELVKKAAAALYNFDVEIVEAHHNKKADAPSGTAIMLADAVKSVSPEKYNVYGRNGIVGARKKEEIGIHSLRGGNIVGEHEVLFAGENETVTLSHTAFDRSVFAEGAVKAAKFIAGKKNGLFDMSDMLRDE